MSPEPSCNRCGRQFTYIVGQTSSRETCGYCQAPKETAPERPPADEPEPKEAA